MDRRSSAAPRLSRRSLLVGGAATLALAACSDGSGPGSGGPSAGATSSSAAKGAGAALTAADFERLGTCRLQPEATAGPFPLDRQIDRRDITEGVPGHPLRLGLRVVDGACAAIPGAVVEVWHADATGDYSAFADRGGGKDEAGATTFLRGSQSAGADGVVEFRTIYPGWYTGRAVHVHLRVHLGHSTALTTQLYFDEGYTASVFATGPYADFGPPDTSIADDALAGSPTRDGTMLALAPSATDQGQGTLALLNLGVEAGTGAGVR